MAAAATTPATGSVVLLRAWLESPVAAMLCDADGFVTLETVLDHSSSLRRLSGGSVQALAAAAASAAPTLELDAGKGAVRLSGALRRLGRAVEQHVKALNAAVGLESLAEVESVAKELACLAQAADRLQVLKDAVARCGSLSCRGGSVVPAGFLSANAVEFVPSWAHQQSWAQPAADLEPAADAGKSGVDSEEQVLEAKADKLNGGTEPAPEGLQLSSFNPVDSFTAKEQEDPEEIGGKMGKVCDFEEEARPTTELQEPDSEPDAETSPCLEPQEAVSPSSAGDSREALHPEEEPCESLPPADNSATSPAVSSSSPTSWAALQRMRRLAAGQMEDGQDVARAVKSILNKLTIEKFEPLSQKLLAVSFRTKSDVEILIQEIFEKATTQHHFIDMYSDLCHLLHGHFTEHPVEDASFKRSLVNQCQASFESDFQRPSSLGDLDPEERIIQETKYKTRMVGNVRLVGALLVRRLIPLKVMLAIFEALLSSPSPESLEAAAVLMGAVGPTFDDQTSSLRPVFTGLFARIRELAFCEDCEPRARCLLKDVLELRACGWRSHRPKKQEKPSTLQEVADRAAAAELPTSPKRRQLQ